MNLSHTMQTFTDISFSSVSHYSNNAKCKENKIVDKIIRLKSDISKPYSILKLI